MSIIRRIIAAIVGIIITFAIGQGAADAAEPSGVSNAVCYEDQPCWDATTMGNRQAGVGHPDGPRNGRCPTGATHVASNAAGREVCDYSGGTGSSSSSRSRGRGSQPHETLRVSGLTVDIAPLPASYVDPSRVGTVASCESVFGHAC